MAKFGLRDWAGISAGLNQAIQNYLRARDRKGEVARRNRAEQRDEEYHTARMAKMEPDKDVPAEWRWMDKMGISSPTRLEAMALLQKHGNPQGAMSALDQLINKPQDDLFGEGASAAEIEKATRMRALMRMLESKRGVDHMRGGLGEAVQGVEEFKSKVLGAEQSGTLEPSAGGIGDPVSTQSIATLMEGYRLFMSGDDEKAAIGYKMLQPWFPMKRSAYLNTLLDQNQGPNFPSALYGLQRRDYAYVPLGFHPPTPTPMQPLDSKQIGTKPNRVYVNNPEAPGMAGVFAAEAGLKQAMEPLDIFDRKGMSIPQVGMEHYGDALRGLNQPVAPESALSSLLGDGPSMPGYSSVKHRPDRRRSSPDTPIWGPGQDPREGRRKLDQLLRELSEAIDMIEKRSGR